MEQKHDNCHLTCVNIAKCEHICVGYEARETESDLIRKTLVSYAMLGAAFRKNGMTRTVK